MLRCIMLLCLGRRALRRATSARNWPWAGASRSSTCLCCWTPVTVPDEVAYWLEAAQWIEVLGRPIVRGMARTWGRHWRATRSRWTCTAVQMQTALGSTNDAAAGWPGARASDLVRQQLDRDAGRCRAARCWSGVRLASARRRWSSRPWRQCRRGGSSFVLWGQCLRSSSSHSALRSVAGDLARSIRSLGDATLPPIPPFISMSRNWPKSARRYLALFEQVAEFLRSLVASQQPACSRAGRSSLERPSLAGSAALPGAEGSLT